MCVITLKKGHWLLGKHTARTIFPFIFIQEEYKNDKGLIQHEKTHIKQVLQCRAFLYFFSKKSRYQLELEAYKAQLKANIDTYLQGNPYTQEDIKRYYDRLSTKYSEYLATKYNLPPGTLVKAHEAFKRYYYELNIPKS